MAVYMTRNCTGLNLGHSRTTPFFFIVIPVDINNSGVKSKILILDNILPNVNNEIISYIVQHG